MKNFFKQLMLVAVAAMAFTACQNDNEEVNALSKGTTFTFTVGFNEDTRVAFSENQDKYNALWEDGDRVVFVAPVANGDYAYEAKFVEAVVLNNGKNAEFTVKFDGEVIPGEIKAYMGTVEQDWDAYDGSYKIQESWSAWQQPKENAPEYVSSVATFDYDGLNVTGNLVFEHYYAYGLVTIADDIAYDKVELKFTYDYVDSYDGNTYPTSTTINLNSDKKNMWFYVKEIDVVNYVEVVAHTDAGTYSKKFDLTERANKLSFNAGVVSKFTVKGLEKDPVMLPAPEVTAKVENLTNVTVEWSAVENAATYELLINSEEVELSAEQIAARKYTFNGEYNTGYSFSVYAVPEEDSTEYLKSDNGYAYVKTDANPNPTIVTFTVAKVIKNGSDMTVDLSDGNGHNFVATFWNINGDVLPAGVYNIGMHFSNYGLTFNGEQIWGDYAGNDMVVTVTDDKLVITVTWYGEKFECTYNGQIAVDANVMPSIYLYGVWDHIKTVTEYGIMYDSSAHLYSVSSYDGIDVSKGLGVVFRNDAWDWFSLVFDTNGLKSIPVGEYTVGSNVSGFEWHREALKTGTVTVAYDEATGYTITCDVASNSHSYKGEFVGAIYDLAAPGEGGGVEPEPEPEPEVNAIQLTSMKSTGSGYNSYGPYYSFEMSNESNSKVAINVSPDASSLTSLNAGSYHYEGTGNIDNANYGFNGKAWIDGSYIGLMQDGSSMVVETDGVNYSISMVLLINGETYNFVCETTFVVITTLETPVVTATVEGNTIKASWNAVPGAGSYALYINGESDGDVIVTSVTYEKLEYSTDYTISVVAKPANAATHKESAAGSVTVTTEADPNAGGGSTTEDFTNWNYRAVIDQSDGTVTLTDLAGNGRVVEFKLNEVAMTTFYGDTSKSNYFTDVKVDGVAATATPESWFKFARAGWSMSVEINMVINGVTYTGKAAQLDF